MNENKQINEKGILTDQEYLRAIHYNKTVERINKSRYEVKNE